MSKKRVLVGMSGGVDSTVSAMLLQQEGYEVTGLYMKLHNRPNYHEIHSVRAQKAADFLGITLYIEDFTQSFDEKVFKPFLETYKAGKTPNPCGLCNRNIKFGKMIEFADTLGIEYIATGHYITHDGSYLYQAKDDTKDQSYFLFYIQKEILKRLIFPLGNRLKQDVKALAANIKALEDFATQAESSEICFVDTTYTEILKEHIDVDMPGEVLNDKGEVIGTHSGYMHYTIGKRKGFRVDGAHVPHYVTQILPQTNQIVVGTYEKLACLEVDIDDVNMFDERTDFTCHVKLRYRTKAVPCRVIIDGSKGHIALKEPVFGVAAGQAAVFYEGNKLLGGGWIQKAY